MLCLGSLLAPSACKKDAGVVYPEAPRDFTGEYYFRGTLKNLTGPQTQSASFNQVFASPYDIWSQTTAFPGQRLVLSNTLNTTSGRLDMDIYGPISPENDPNYFLWPLGTLDSVFWVGQKLRFGKGARETTLSFRDSSVPFIDPNLGCWSTPAHLDNSDSFLEITALEDLRPYVDSDSWVKKMNFRVKCRLGHLSGFPEDVFEMEGEGAILLWP